MTSLSRDELIKALVKGLKLDDNIFNYQAVAEETEQIQKHQFMDFFKAVMKEDTFGNGLKAIMITVEKFKPITKDLTEIKAKELISLVHAMNYQVFNDSVELKVPFSDLIDKVKFTDVSDDDIAVLNRVKPHYNLRTLVSQINSYPTSLEQLEAFKQAINTNTLSIEGGVYKMIRKVTV